MITCNKCVVYGNCSYEPHSKECQSARQCEFCLVRSKGLKLYEVGVYEVVDGINSFHFDPIVEMNYCPVCGAEL